MKTLESLEQFLGVQLRAWARCAKAQTPPQAGPVIAITREPGCRGEAIARLLAKKFGLVLYDAEIVEQIAKDAHVSEQVVATLSGKVSSELNVWLDDLSGGSGLSARNYLKCLRSVLFTIATHGNAVILGRGANFLIPGARRTVGLCLVAPFETRVRHIMQTLSLSWKAASKHVARADKEQKRWVSRYGQADITDAAHYHLVINTALVKADTIVQLVGAMITPAASVR
jgi:cytidylate kinase